MVHLDPDGLKGPLGGMASRSAHLHGDGGLDDLGKLICRLHRPLPAGSHNVLGDVLCELFLPVIPDDPVEGVLAVLIYHLGRCQGSALVHPHVKGGVFPVRKSPLRGVQLVGRHPQIQADPVHFADLQVRKHLLYILIVAFYDRNFISVFLQAVRGSLYGVLVLINADQPSLFSQPLAHQQGVASSPQSPVHIDALRLYHQTVHGLSKKH